jgi:hypothetical protein
VPDRVKSMGACTRPFIYIPCRREDSLERSASCAREHEKRESERSVGGYHIGTWCCAVHLAGLHGSGPAGHRDSRSKRVHCPRPARAPEMVMCKLGQVGLTMGASGVEQGRAHGSKAGGEKLGVDDTHAREAPADLAGDQRRLHRTDLHKGQKRSEGDEEHLRMLLRGSHRLSRQHLAVSAQDLPGSCPVSSVLISRRSRRNVVCTRCPMHRGNISGHADGSCRSTGRAGAYR